MKYLSAVLLIFFTIYLISADAFQCYECLYKPSDNDSDPTCQKTPAPSFIQPCELTPEKDEEYMCLTISGTVGGEDVVLRGCITADSDYNGKCETYPKYSLDGVNVTNAVLCFCAEEICNDEDLSAASNLQITYLSLLALAVHGLYKFV